MQNCQDQNRVRYFNLSLHRSATRSFCHFCDAIGLRACHWPGLEWDEGCRGLRPKAVALRFMADFSNFDAYADIPIPSIYRDLSPKYPNAKFLLILREPEEWLQSVRRHIGGRSLYPLEQLQYKSITRRKISYISQLSDSQLLKGYRRHENQVRRFFKKQSERLAVFDLATENLSEKLSEFLGVSSLQDFPHHGRAVEK